jgi:uncharacterized protein YgbK (DUF1537 family)
MHESELAKVLLTQGFQTDHVLDVRQLDQHQTAPEHLTKMLASHHSAVVDGYTQQQVVTAAAALWRLSQQRQICAMAAQGLAHGLGQFLRESQHTQLEAPKQHLLPTDRLLVLSGSCSALSAAQIDHAEQAGFVCLRLSNDALLDDVQTRMLKALSAGQSVVVFTARGHEQTHDWPTGQLVQRIGACFAKLADAAFRQTALTRLVVAGGDSSSYTMRALGAEALQIKASHFAQNAHFASLVSAKAHIHGKEVLLKGGQVGDAQLYSLVLKGFNS